MTPIISINDVSKVFTAASSNSPFGRTLRRWFRKPLAARRRRVGVEGIEMQIGRGEWVALVGNNGAGKTTLLRLIAGLHRPSAGSIDVRGKTLLLSGVGRGMIEDLSVLENVYLYASVYGMGRGAVERLLPEILDWADLSDTLSERFSALSSGMRSRLAFSVSRHLSADIFLLDEALSAGDQTFRAKCRDHFVAMKEGPATVVVATHDTRFVEEFCDRTLWLDHGRVAGLGPSPRIAESYRKSRSGGGVAGR